ncbi:MAG: 50S ribosomal protein L22 [Chloroflexi bacterium]|nr:50S ribosomal protein L22 [Chloroflexota bacterium]
MEVQAKAKYLKVSSRKLRLVADAVRGKRVGDALATLRFIPSPAARLVAKAVKSASANAENNFQMAPEALTITRIAADEGPTVKRFRPRAHGRVSPILKRTSHLTVVVDER